MIATVEVERFSLISSRPFDKILASITAARGHPDMVAFAKRTAAAPTFPEFESVIREGLGKTDLMLFMELDHGAVIRKATDRDKPRMVRLIMCNPLIMQQMARYAPDAGSYAPVTVLIDERSDGVHISYDGMASLLAPYRNSEALTVARDLDKKVETYGNVFLSLGGEIRETYERFHNPNFGLSPDDPDGYLLQRYLFHVDFHAGQRFRFFGELNSSLEDGRTGGPRPLDEDKLDVHQGFVDFVVLKSRENSSLTLRIGRQEMAFGSGRMIDLVEGPNVPLSFDGFRLSWKSPEWKVDGFATRPVQNEPGVFNDPPQHDFAFWGLYATHPLGQTQRKTLDFYYVGLDLKHAVFNQGSGHEKRHTLGARVWGERGPWAYDAEAMYQFGSFGVGTINAWRVAADNWYSFSSVRWRPRIGLATDFASGDKNPANPDLQTFNSLFQSGTYSGRANILGPDNAIRMEPSLGLFFSKRLTLSAGWGCYWRESSNDGLYGVPGNLIVPSNGVKSRYEGSCPIAQLDWQMTRHLSTHVNYIYVFNASFEEQSIHATTSVSYISPWITYRF